MQEIITHPIFLGSMFAIIIILFTQLYHFEKENDRLEENNGILYKENLNIKYIKMLDDKKYSQILDIKIEQDNFLKFKLIIYHSDEQLVFYVINELLEELNILDGFYGNLKELRNIFPKKHIYIYNRIYSSI